MSLAWRCSTEQVASDTERGFHAAAEGTKDGGKPDHATGMLSMTAIFGGVISEIIEERLWLRPMSATQLVGTASV